MFSETRYRIDRDADAENTALVQLGRCTVRAHVSRRWGPVVSGQTVWSSSSRFLGIVIVIIIGSSSGRMQ